MAERPEPATDKGQLKTVNCTPFTSPSFPVNISPVGFAPLTAYGGVMANGAGDRTPASKTILAASLVFTLTVYSVFTFLWKVPVPLPILFCVLGGQSAVLLLGGSKVLTPLGAASLAALLAVAAGLAAVARLLPPALELRLAGGFGGGVSVLFVLASFVAASRSDPASPEGGQTPGVESGVPAVEGVPGAGEEAGKSPVPSDHTLFSPSGPLSPQGGEGDPELPSPAERGDDVTRDDEPVYEFDDIDDDLLEISLGREVSLAEEDPLELTHSPGQEPMVGEDLFRDEGATPPETDSGPSAELVIPEDWVEEAARNMAYEEPEERVEEEREKAGGTEKPVSSSPSARSPEYRMRTHYRVLDAISGEHFGTYYGDEGFSTLDPVSLGALLGAKLQSGDIRIVKLDWSNFDEVEVHVQAVDLQEEDEGGQEPAPGPGSREDLFPQGSDAVDEVPLPEADDGFLPVEQPLEREGPGGIRGTPRYVIYHRRNMQRMAEFLPEGNLPRIDRLTLYRMFPEYDFKTFEIDSIRWHDGEVRIFIRGEKKDKKASAV